MEGLQGTRAPRQRACSCGKKRRVLRALSGGARRACAVRLRSARRLAVAGVGGFQEIGHRALEGFGNTIVRLQIEQRRGRRLDAVEKELISVALGEDHELALIERHAARRVGVVKVPTVSRGFWLHHELAPNRWD